MLALLSNLFNGRGVDILPRSHGAYFNPPVRDALSRDKLFIQVRLSSALLSRFDIRLILPEAPVDVKIFRLYHMMLLSF
jgi:hypothetical protein